MAETIRAGARGCGWAPRIALVLAALLAACGQSAVERRASARTGGDPERGRQAVRRYSCVSCHSIPGVREAPGLTGPSLAGLGGREFLAGRLPNTPDNLIRWVRDPQSVQRSTAMPNLGVTEAEARDIAAFLYTLQ
jgi:cytochrome c